MTALDRLEDAVLEAGLTGSLPWWRCHRILELIYGAEWLEDWDYLARLEAAA